MVGRCVLILHSCLQMSLERMDELFGVADFSKVDDVGVAAKHAREAEDIEHTDEVHVASKV